MTPGVAPVRDTDGVVHWAYMDPYVVRVLDRDTVHFLATLCIATSVKLVRGATITCVMCAARRGNMRELNDGT